MAEVLQSKIIVMLIEKLRKKKYAMWNCHGRKFSILVNPMNRPRIKYAKQQEFEKHGVTVMCAPLLVKTILLKSSYF